MAEKGSERLRLRLEKPFLAKLDGREIPKKAPPIRERIPNHPDASRMAGKTSERLRPRLEKPFLAKLDGRGKRRPRSVREFPTLTDASRMAGKSSERLRLRLEKPFLAKLDGREKSPRPLLELSGHRSGALGFP